MEILSSFLIAASIATVAVGIFMALAHWITARREERRIREIVGWVPATATKERPIELRQITARAVQWSDGDVPFRAYARDLKIWEWPSGERIVIVATWVDHASSQQAVEAAAAAIELAYACRTFRVSERELIVNVRRLGRRRLALQEVLDWVRAVLDSARAASE
ncbi:MAG: hypothetical protein ACJAYU_003204 [Bradymonadia bacterium]|jgi:hypothetical protein